MPRRSGITLLEVLVAIFVMGIGLLAILVLFPLGALRMYKAIQDQRCSQAGASAWAVAGMTNIANEPGLYLPSDGFLNPGNGASNALPDQPSYPVFVDPFGSLTAVGLQSVNLGQAGASFIARRNVSFVTAAGPVAAQRRTAYQWFTLLDEIDFESDPASNPGTPRLFAPLTFARDVRYSWAYMCQRPRYGDASVVDTSVVVFNQRSLTLSAALSLAETPFTTSTFNAAANIVNINYAPGPAPNVRVGDWILDATPVGAGNSTVTGANPTRSAHGYFYRVVSVNDNGGNVDLEVESPIRGFPLNVVGAGNPVLGTVLVLDGIAEVYTKGTMRLP
jgi:hypothetical protein